MTIRRRNTKKMQNAKNHANRGTRKSHQNLCKKQTDISNRRKKSEKKMQNAKRKKKHAKRGTRKLHQNLCKNIQT